MTRGSASILPGLWRWHTFSASKFANHNSIGQGWYELGLPYAKHNSEPSKKDTSISVG